MEGYTSTEKKLVLLACCLSGFINPLLSTMMNLSLVSISDDFGVGSHQLGYVNTAFLLASVVFMVPLSKGADIIGKRRMFLTGLLVIVVACILACFSPSFWWLIGCRVLLGAGAAAIVSTGISMIADVYREHRGGAIGIQTTCVYIGLAAGPPLGGTLNDLIGWHALFLLVIPLAAGAFICLSMFKHEIAPNKGRHFDATGAVLYGIGIVLAMGGVINLPQTWAFAMLIVGAAVLALFVRWELKVEDHLLNIRLFRSRVFSGSCVAAFLNYAASYSISYFMALYLQSIGALTATEAGTLMLVQAGMQALLTSYFGKLSDRMEDKRILPTLGMAIVSVGVATFLFYGTEMNIVLVMATMIIVGSGMGMFAAPNTSVIMGSVGKDETSEASGMVSVMRQTGMMVSMGIAMLLISVIMGGADHLVPENYGVFVDVMHYAFAVYLGMCLVGMLASLLRGRSGTADV